MSCFRVKTGQLTATALSLCLCACVFLWVLDEICWCIRRDVIAYRIRASRRISLWFPLSERDWRGDVSIDVFSSLLFVLYKYREHVYFSACLMCIHI